MGEQQEAERRGRRGQAGLVGEGLIRIVQAVAERTLLSRLTFPILCLGKQ